MLGLSKKYSPSWMKTIIRKMKALSLEDDPTQQPVSSTSQVRSSFSTGVQSPPSVMKVSMVDQSALSSNKLASKRKQSEVEDRLDDKRGFSTAKKQRRFSKERPCSHTEMSKTQQRVPNIWIIGSSYIKRGEWAARHTFGENFGLDANVHWFGKTGMRWDGVLLRFNAELTSRKSPPDILVIHAGSDDLGLISAQELSSAMTKDLTELHARIPSMTILYSCINERQVWRYRNPKYMMDMGEKTVNSVMRKAVHSFGGFIIEHPSVRYYDETLFGKDGIHFNKKGNDVFLTNIRCAIKKIL
ncbi:unnamed protein product [Oreochromis niloticus]|nr:unnamed protein product [Mustela putorius furo]